MREDVHPEGGTQFADALSDAPEADHSEGFPGEFSEVRIFPETEIRAVFPCALLGEFAVEGGAFREIQDK